ncbi:hypothetical protein IP84_13950 [beta proteobacterium AAP99]|nr:hypothetical protein IP84_13950 [beta proteobacterium AAP99]
MLALEHGTGRDHLYENHPVTRNEVAVATPPLREAYGAIEGVIVHRDPGTCLLGDFRAGKSTAIERAVRELQQTFPDLPVGIALAKGHDAFTQGTFFSDLLVDFAHGGALRGTAQEKRLRCLNMLLAHARELRSDRYLLMVDEAQNWGEQQWTWLRDLANDMAIKRVRLVTIAFGDGACLSELRALLLARRRTDLIGRFLLSPREFRGLNSEEELKATLEEYDDPRRSAYPIGSDVSYSEFFLPKSWGRGWRLAHEAQGMWSEFKAVSSRSGKSISSIGMNWIGGAVRNFLFVESLTDDLDRQSQPGKWVQPVLACGFESTLF